MKNALKVVTPHLGSSSLSLASVAIYFTDETLITQFLPINGKPLAIITIWALVFLYEKGINDARCQQDRHTEVLVMHRKTLQLMEGHRVIQDVNSLYSRFKASGDAEISNEYSIIEVARLVDARDRLSINSYTQARLEYLLTKIRRD